VTIKLRLKKKSGSYIWTEVTYSNRLNIKGIDGYILNIIDIDNDEKSANELKAVNERFKLAESATKNIIWDYYTERQEYVINTSFKTLFGVDDPLISAEKWTELIHEDDRSRVQESFDKLASNREQNLWLIDYRLRKPDGNYLWTSSKATTLRNAQGEVIRVIGSMTDVTERVLYEKSIQQQNDKLKDIAWMQSHLVRAPLANLLGLLELLKDCSSEEREQMEGLIFESATKLDSIIKNIVKNAERLGEKQYLVDDSSMQSNKDLIPSIHLHPQLLEMAPRAYIICNKTKRIVFVNKAFEELSGYPMEELLSKKYIDHLFPNNTNKETQEYTLLKEKQRESYEVELLLKSKNETNIWVRVNGQPFISEEGVHQGYFFSLKNIEAEKETQKTILEKTENLTHINEELKHFTYTISHDLKEPINGLSGLLSLLKAETDDQSSEDAKQYLSLAAKSVDRISAMVKSLLEYSKSGSDTEAAKTVSLQSVIDEIKLGLRLQIEKNNAQVILHGEDQFISVHPIQFSRVLQNLINNSIKFKSEKDPIINIYLKELEKHWEISVEDNGKGIHKGDINHVFDLFYFNNKDKNESHGIGLAVVKKLVERHQGEISVKSEVGKGTTFCFTISKELFH
jgi:PAS domain S-box-containing protein